MSSDESQSLKESDSQLHCRGCCTRLESLGVSLGGRRIIQNVNLHFHCGEFTVIIGPNGSGKSTLLKALVGEVGCEGRLIFHRFANPEPIRPRIGYVPQKIPFDTAAPLSVEDLFALCLSRKPGWFARDRVVRELALDALNNVNATHLLKRNIGRLSQGELQRVVLSLALTPRPDILLLDEPVSGIDFSGLGIFYEMISELRRKHDLSIVMVSHDLALCARYADRFIFLNRGTIVDGKPQSVLDNAVVRGVFGNILLPAEGGGLETGAHHE